ncbi:iron-hydroxamate ABC transporter substrate-binding protein [Paenibacillus nanensis]
MNGQRNTLKMTGLISIMLLALLLTACGSNNNGNQGAASESPAAETATPAPSEEPAERKLTDGLGHEVTIPAEPKRIIASYLEDYLVALDTIPVAQWSVANGKQEYLSDKLGDTPTIAYDLPFEAVLGFEPDLLIIGGASGVEGDKYNQYSEIAPTFVLGDEVNNDWRQALLKIGEVLGKSEQAQQILDDYETKASEAKATLQAKAGGESAAAIWLVSGSFYVVSDSVSSGAVLYKDLGLAIPETVKEISAAAEANWNAISLEKLAQLDADHIFLINSDGSGAEALKDPVWSSIPAVKNGNVYEFGREKSWLYTGPIANSQMIDDVLASMAK